MVTRRMVVVLVPLLLSVATFLAVGGVWLEQERSAKVVDELTRNHVRAVLALVEEATRVAVAIRADGFAELEGRLLAESERLLDSRCVGSCLEQADTWLRVRVVQQAGESLSTVWGPIPPPERPELVEIAGRSRPGLILLEPELESAPFLICALGGGRLRTGIFCADADALEQRLRAIGPGAILRGVEARGVEYVAIQDEAGILAASPSVERLSSVEQDPFLRQLDGSEPESLHYRATLWNGTEVLEGVGLIDLPDGSRALLRVGVDATRLSQVTAQRQTRRIRLIIAGALVLLLACLATWALHRRLRVQERYRVEQERFAREEARWKDLGRMAAMTAHEVRNPLSTIRMAAQRVELEHVGAENAELKELCDVITGEIDRLDGVIGDFLALNRPLSIEPKPVSLRALADEAVLSLKMHGEREGKQILVSGDPDLEVPVDRARMLQVIHNLVRNALDATGPSGSVQIRVGLDENRGATASIEVADNGPGMSEDEKSRALETFYTTKSFGTGLGLPLVKRIAEGHGGSFELTDQPGGGLCAVVRVPLTPTS